MPKIASHTDFAVILAVISQAKKPLSIESISDLLPVNITRRTLQRRLAQLVEQKQIAPIGNGAGRCYQGVVSANSVSIQPTQVSMAQGEIYLPISSTAKKIKNSIRRAIIDRQPVGYQADFLRSYRPNITMYLTAEICQHLQELGAPKAQQIQPAGTYARQVFDRLLIDLSWNSSRLEGNTYSLLETERLLMAGETADGNNAFNAQMILNHKAAIEFLVEAAEETGFNRYTLLNLHALLANNLLADPMAGGRLRTIAVGISHTVYEPLAVPALIEEYFQDVLATAAMINNPFEQAFFVMVHLPYLQPFEDVNKRVSRLAANLPLIKYNLCPLSFVDVPEQAYVDGILGVYELNRIELLRDVFVWAYERSCARYAAVRQSLGEPDFFRLQHRLLIAELINEVVLAKLDKKQATAYIREQIKSRVEAHDSLRFIEVIETELLHLHEGNIARYRLRPSQYHAWQVMWRT